MSKIKKLYHKIVFYIKNHVKQSIIAVLALIILFTIIPLLSNTNDPFNGNFISEKDETLYSLILNSKDNNITGTLITTTYEGNKDDNTIDIKNNEFITIHEESRPISLTKTDKQAYGRISIDDVNIQIINQNTLLFNSEIIANNIKFHKVDKKTIDNKINNYKNKIKKENIEHQYKIKKINNECISSQGEITITNDECNIRNTNNFPIASDKLLDWKTDKWEYPLKYLKNIKNLKDQCESKNLIWMTDNNPNQNIDSNNPNLYLTKCSTNTIDNNKDYHISLTPTPHYIEPLP